MRSRSDDKYGPLLMLPEVRFAHAAVARLLEPSPPMVTIHAAAGMGKTHLTRSIVREIRRQEPQFVLSSVTAAEFSAEFARASKEKSISEFQESYRRVDLFICEDLQAIEGRRNTQQQLLAILDAILAEGGRVLLTCSKSPGELSRFSSKLRSRCQGGVCATIEPFSGPSREKLLVHFAEERGFVLAADIAAQLADSLVLSPRELRGTVNRLELLARQLRKPVDRDIARSVIAETVVPSKPTLSQITKVVAKAFSVTAADLKSQGRLQGLVLPRQLAMFAAREWAGKAYSEIGKHFRRRSHSTIVHACQRVSDRLETDTDFRQIVESVREQLNVCGAPQSTTSTTC